MSNHSKRTSAVSRTKKVAVVGGGALVAASPFVATGTAQAASFTVTNLDDSGAGSLRQALLDANASSGADVIVFQAGLTGTITLAGSELLVLDAVDIQGPGSSLLTIDADGSSMVFYTRVEVGEVSIAISGLTLTGGFNTANGGAIVSWGDDLTLSDMVISGNEGDAAGAIYFYGGYDGDSGTLSILNSTISGNTGDSYAGGIYLYTGGNVDTPSLILSDSTVSGNDAGGSGGGLYVNSDVKGDVVIINSTFSDNYADSDGGGIFVNSTTADVYILNSTITGNAADDGGGLYFDGSASSTAVISNSVIAGNSGVNSSDDVYFSTTSGATADVNYSLIGEADGIEAGGIGNLTGDPLLGSLADNGGATLTHLPLAGSPLIDAGNPAGPTPPPDTAPGVASFPLTDQRGLDRVSNDRLDIGAVEIQVEKVLPPTGGSNGLMAGLGAALLGLGGALHLTGRRKRTA